METKSRKALHRGLQALISRVNEDTLAGERQLATHVSVGQIKANPFQPRRRFNEEELAELKASIEQHGVIEPVVLRQTRGGYEIISGERRLRAAAALGHTDIPAVVRDKVSDREMLLLSLVENQQRADLNDIEIAGSYQELVR